MVFGENWQDAFDEIGLSKFAATKEVVEKVINHVNKRGIDGQNIPIEEAIRQMKSIAPLGDILEAVDKDDYGRRYLEAEEFLNKVFGRSLSGAIKALDIHGDFGAECQEVSRLYEILVRNPS